MYCEECKSRPSEVYLTQMFNGQQVELHLCSECAARRGIGFLNLGNALSLPKLLSSFFGFGPTPLGNVQTMIDKSCPNCSTRFDQIGQQGKLGCSECYQVFQAQLEPILRRVHGNNLHTGKIPQKSAGQLRIRKKIEALKSQLQTAVAREQYETAAEIRDTIKKLEKEAMEG